MNGKNSSRLSRRAMLVGLGFGVTAVGAFATPVRHLGWTEKPARDSRWRDRQKTPLSTAGIEDWRRQIGTEFVLEGGSLVRLAEVQTLSSGGPRPAGVRGQAFAALFEPVAGKVPPGNRILGVSHAQGGAMKIYFSPCTGKCGGRRLQAVFN
ncbi:MAG TPA: hypothetical protein VF619_00390 [Allosphingosinicella sp.]|jgi:hypothetical protein